MRLGTVDRRAQDNFLAPGERTGTMRLDFTMWVARQGNNVVAIDTGFAREAGTHRGRTLDIQPADAVRLLGIEPAQVATVIITHLHYDHAGNIADFPNATVVVQAGELAYVTGARMRHPALKHFFEVDDIVGMVRGIHAGTVRVLDGDATLADGLQVCLIGGHTEGLQAVRIRTARGWVVFASDAFALFCETCRNATRFPRFSIWARCSTATTASSTWQTPSTTSFPATTRWCSSATAPMRHH